MSNGRRAWVDDSVFVADRETLPATMVESAPMWVSRVGETVDVEFISPTPAIPPMLIPVVVELAVP